MEDPTCYWTYDMLDGFYGTTCGHGFIFDQDRPQEFAYCPYCGQEIIWIKYGENEED